MSGLQRVGMQLVSPVLAFGLLLLLLGLQLSLKAVLPTTYYRGIFVPTAMRTESSEPPIHSSLSVDEQQQAPESLSKTAVVYPKKTDETDVHAADGSVAGEVEVAGAAGGLSTEWLSYQRSCVRLLQLSYTSLAVTSLSYFRYQPVGPFGRRLTDYPSIDPSSADYAHFTPIVAVVLALVSLLPLVMAAVLFRAHRLRHIEHAKSRTRHLALSARDSFLLQWCSMYRPSCWFYSVVVLCRRMALVVPLVLWHDADVWAVMSMINFLFLALHLRLLPYERRQDNLFESAALLSLALQTTLLSLFPPPYLTAGLLVTFGLLVVAPLALLLQRLSCVRSVPACCRRAVLRSHSHRSLTLALPLLTDSTMSDHML